jgi:hypothetical protein
MPVMRFPGPGSPGACRTLIDQIDRQVFNGDLSDEACSNIDLSPDKLAKSEVALQDT